jgi:hypothetical protein
VGPKGSASQLGATDRSSPDRAADPGSQRPNAIATWLAMAAVARVLQRRPSPRRSGLVGGVVDGTLGAPREGWDVMDRTRAVAVDEFPLVGPCRTGGVTGGVRSPR